MPPTFKTFTSLLAICQSNSMTSLTLTFPYFSLCTRLTGFSKGQPLSLKNAHLASTPCTFSKSISPCTINTFPISLNFGFTRTGVFLLVLGSLTEFMPSSLPTKLLAIPCMPVVQLHSPLLAPLCSKSRILVIGLPMPSSFTFEKIHFLFKVLSPGTQLLIHNRMIISSYFTTFLPSTSMVTICVFTVILLISTHRNKIGHLGHPHYSRLFCPISHPIIPVFPLTNHNKRREYMFVPSSV